MAKAKPLTERAAEAANDAKSSSAELTAIKTEISIRLGEIEMEHKRQKRAIEQAEASGNLDRVRAERQKTEDLRDEEKLLRRHARGLHDARTQALGREAVADAAQHRKALADARDKAAKARGMIAEAEATARRAASARKQAHEIHQRIDFDPATIRDLAELIHGAGTNASKQLRIDLGQASASQKKLLNG